MPSSTAPSRLEPQSAPPQKSVLARRHPRHSCRPYLRIHPIPHVPAHLQGGGLDIAQQLAGLGQFVECFGGDLGGNEHAPLLALDVVGGEGFQPVERAGLNAAGRRAGGLTL